MAYFKLIRDNHNLFTTLKI